MLNLVQKIFKIRACDDSYFSNRKKPCLQYQIDRCDAPCVKKISSRSYGDLVKNSLKANKHMVNKKDITYEKKMENTKKV